MRLFFSILFFLFLTEQEIFSNKRLNTQLVNPCKKVNKWPNETIVFDIKGNWKEIARYATDKNWLVELIPIDQTEKNWTDLCFINYIECSKLDSEDFEIKFLADYFKNSFLKSYPKEKITWNLIEENNTDFIFEWFSNKNQETNEVWHEIIRVFIKDKSCYLVGFAKENVEIKTDERNFWIKLLKDNAKLVPFKEGAHFKELSLADKFKNSYTLEGYFSNWNKNNSCLFEAGNILNSYSPLKELFDNRDEILEVMIFPKFNYKSIYNLLEYDKDNLKSVYKEIKFDILDESPFEINYTYYFTMPYSYDLVSNVTRMLETEQRYYCFTLRKSVKKEMTKEEILTQKERLKDIKIKHSVHY